jgi:hypothetical protein
MRGFLRIIEAKQQRRQLRSSSRIMRGFVRIIEAKQQRRQLHIQKLDRISKMTMKLPELFLFTDPVELEQIVQIYATSAFDNQRAIDIAKKTIKHHQEHKDKFTSSGFTGKKCCPKLVDLLKQRLGLTKKIYTESFARGLKPLSGGAGLSGAYGGVTEDGNFLCKRNAGRREGFAALLHCRLGIPSNQTCTRLSVPYQHSPRYVHN